jgi:hypothetical protein
VSTRIVLEGPQLEPLLEQVRDDYGNRAKIVSANKIRSGGLAGFFAKQRFELAVEVGEESADGSGVGEPTDTLLDLVAAREDRFEPESAPSSPAAPSPPAAEAAPTVSPVRSGARTVTPLAIPSLSGPAPSPGPGAGQPVPPRASVMSTNGAAFAEVMAGLQDDLARARRDPAPGLDQRGDAHQRDLPDPAPRFERRPNPARPQPPVLAANPLGADLAALGVPADLAARARGEDPYQSVLDAFAALPEPPALPSRPGDVLVIAGELAAAVPTAQWAAKKLRLDPTQVLLAGPTTAGTPIHPSRRITGAPDAQRRAGRMHRADVPWIVVFDAPLGVDPDWAQTLCDALEATAVWATVDATRKAADTVNHLRGIGRTDALAVYHADLCADPGTVLCLPAPVALLDGLVATAHEWAALLSRRLSERRAVPAGRTGREAPWR